MMCNEAGVKIAAGTDNTYWDVPGMAWELQTYVKHCGLKPMDAIESATRIGADLCRLEKVGTVEARKYADLVIVDGDPLEDIGVLQKKDRIDTVIKEGEVVAKKGVLTYH